MEVLRTASQPSCSTGEARCSHDESDQDWIRASAASIGRTPSDDEVDHLAKRLGAAAEHPLVRTARERADCSVELHRAATLLQLRLAGSYALVLGGDAARPLARLGLIYPIVAAYITAIDAILTAVLISIAGLLFWRKPRHRLPLLVSTTMLALVAGSAPVIALYRTQPEWQAPVDVLFGLGLGCVVGFFLLLLHAKLSRRSRNANARSCICWPKGTQMLRLPRVCQ